MAEWSVKSSRWRRFTKGLSTVNNLAQMLVSGPDRRVRLYYDMYTPDNYPTKESLYVNLGYWTPGCTDIDVANQALAEVLAEAAGIEEGHRVLDAGFGYADQDMYWLETRKPEQIVGINITPHQVEVARERVRDRGLEGKLDLHVASATKMPFEAGTFDRVVALEAAMHFKTRQDFFKEAWRVLRPGGVLATADEVPLQVKDRAEMTREERAYHRFRLFVLPPENWHTRDTYIEQLREVGFVDIDARPITDNVYKPLIGYLSRAREDLAGRDAAADRHQRLVLSRHLEVLERKLTQPLEYIIVSAAKPA